jgi:Lrp/AsnC family transcriptional regulator
MDRIDRKILALMQDDASLPVSEIAAKVNLSQTPCWNRIRKLEDEGVIRSRVAIVDPRKVGLGLTVFVSVEAQSHSRDWAENFSRRLRAMPEVMDLYRMAGDVDYLLRVIVPGMDAYDAFYKKLIEITPLKNVTSRFAMEHLSARTALPISENG